MTSEYFSSPIAGPLTRRNKPNSFAGHDGCINAVCYSPDGRRIATGGRKPYIKIWDADTGEILFQPRSSRSSLFGAVISLCYSPDGKRLVSWDDCGKTCIWSASDGEIALECAEAPSRATTIAYSPDSQYIASSGPEGKVQLWRAEGMTQVVEFPEHPEHVQSISFSPDGRHLATGCRDGRIRIFDVAKGVLVALPLDGHTDWVQTVTYSPNGKLLASCSKDYTIRLWDALTGEMLSGPLKAHFDVVHCLVYAPDGKRLVSASDDKTIRFWDPDTGKLIAGPVRGHDGDITAVSFAPDGARFVTGSDDGTMRLWDVQTQEIISPKLTKDTKERYQLTGPFRGHTGEITAVAHFPDGERVASTASDGSIRIWGVRTGEELVRLLIGHNGGVHSIAISSDGSRLASGGLDGMTIVWDTHSGSIFLGPLGGHSNAVSRVQFSPDDRFIASSDSSGELVLWDLQTGEQLRSIRGHNGRIWALSFSADAIRLASGNNEKAIGIWDVSTMEMVSGPFKGHTGWIQSVDFSPDGLRIVCGSDDGTWYVWDTMTGTLLFRSLELPLDPLKIYLCGVTSVFYSPDGARICSITHDGQMYLWHATTGNLALGPLRGHKGAILSVAFSPDGKYLVTGSDDYTIRFWDVSTGEIMQFPKYAHELSVTHVDCQSIPLVEHVEHALDLTEKIRRLDDHCCAGGGFGDVHKCLYDGPLGTLEVAVKELRFSMMSEKGVDKSEKGILSKPLRRELGIWKRLDHQNIVPFLGTASGFGPYTSLVSVWMPNGTLQAFLEKYDDQLSIIDRCRLLKDIISGLEYLHSRLVSHGDLTPCNILVDGDFRARLTDFGFSSAIGNLPACLAYLRRSTQRPGAIRWAAPEKLLQQSDRASEVTTKSDIYSFGCIMLQVLSGEQPWLGIKNFMIPVYMFNGTKPPRPSSHIIDDQHWNLIEECFLPVNKRPSTKYVAARITSILASLSPLSGTPSGGAAGEVNTSSQWLTPAFAQAGVRSEGPVTNSPWTQGVARLKRQADSDNYDDGRNKRPKLIVETSANFADSSK